MIDREIPIKSVQSKEEVIKEWVLTPLIESYEIIKEEINTNTWENEITKKIILGVKNKSSISRIISKRSIRVFYRAKEVHDKDLTKEPDITFVIGEDNILHQIDIEAKRIYENGTVSDYCGKTGLCEFLSGNYSSNEDNGGMIAYIQEGCFSDIQKEIIARVDSCNCIELIEDIGIDNSFLSRHERAIHREIKIYHLLFDFVK